MRGDRPVIRAIKGPIILITLGVLFALQSFNIYGFDQTWPVLLIVVGLLSLFGRASREAPPAPPPPQGWTNVPPYPPNTWPQPKSEHPSSYSQSPYAQPGSGSSPQAGAGAPPDAGSAGTAKGGFGGSAPQRENPPAGSNPGGSV